MSVVFLWSLDALGQVSQDIFTLFLAADLLAFALMGHIYLATKRNGDASEAWVVIGAVAVFALLAAGVVAS